MNEISKHQVEESRDRLLRQLEKIVELYNAYVTSKRFRDAIDETKTLLQQERDDNSFGKPFLNEDESSKLREILTGESSLKYKERGDERCPECNDLAKIVPNEVHCFICEGKSKPNQPPEEAAFAFAGSSSRTKHRS